MGLAQAITISASHVDEVIGEPVRRLAAALGDRSISAGAAVREFADALDDRVADTVAAALLLALGQQSVGIARVLRLLADGVARDVRARRDIEAARAEARQSIRMLLLIQAGVLGDAGRGALASPPRTPPRRADGDGAAAGRARWRCWCGCAASRWATGHPASSEHRPQSPWRPGCLRRPGCRGRPMNPLLMLLLAGGALAGTGVAVAAAGFGRRPPSLAAALVALDERTLPAAVEPVSWWTRLVRRVPGSVPEQRCGGVGVEPRPVPAGPVATTLGYAAAGPALATLSGLFDLGLPLTVPAVFTVAGALFGWTGVARSVRDRAEEAREELRFALVSFLQQVGLLRQGGAGVATALSLPARLLADRWAMRRIADELDVAERVGQMPWEGLRRFGEQMGVDELTDLSAIAASAGRDGAAVVDTLLKRAESLRDELLADAARRRAPRQRTDEHARSTAGVPDRGLGALPGRRRPPVVLAVQPF